MTKLVLAYDRKPKTLDELEQDFKLIKPLLPALGAVKIGLEAMTNLLHIKNDFYTTAAIALHLEILNKKGAVLWDQKVHDIGNTMAATIRNLVSQRLPPMGITVHAGASEEGLSSAVAARDAHTHKWRTILFGVTLLTDIAEMECAKSYGISHKEFVYDHAVKLKKAGFDGIVCSAHELEMLAQAGLKKHFTTLVPGIRPEWAVTGDQKRVMTPREAALLGADYIVVGRPVWEHPDPAEAVRLINAEIAEALSA